MKSKVLWPLSKRTTLNDLWWTIPLLWFHLQNFEIHLVLQHELLTRHNLTFASIFLNWLFNCWGWAACSGGSGNDDGHHGRGITSSWRINKFRCHLVHGFRYGFMDSVINQIIFVKTSKKTRPPSPAMSTVWMREGSLQWWRRCPDVSGFWTRHLHLSKSLLSASGQLIFFHLVMHFYIFFGEIFLFVFLWMIVVLSPTPSFNFFWLVPIRMNSFPLDLITDETIREVGAQIGVSET